MSRIIAQVEYEGPNQVLRGRVYRNPVGGYRIVVACRNDYQARTLRDNTYGSNAYYAESRLLENMLKLRARM